MVTAETIWLTIGVGGQATFGLRMLVQWYASERAGKSVVPPLFWYISLGGSLMMLAYAIWRRDPVFIFGQSLPLPVYVRNVMLILRERRDRTVTMTGTTTGTPTAEPSVGLRLADLSPEAPPACSCPCVCGARKAA